MALGRPPFKKKVTCRNKENGKQYETKRVWNFLQSWLVGNKGVLKGGGVQLLLPLNFSWGKVKKRCKENEKWMGREVVVPVNIF